MIDNEPKIKFIKWGCGYADGFKYIEGDFKDDCILTAPSGKDYEIYCLGDYSEGFSVIYPLFLQRVIEGVNRSCHNGCKNPYTIIQSHSDLFPYNWDTMRKESAFHFDDYDTIDQAKEASLIWIMEHE